MQDHICYMKSTLINSDPTLNTLMVFIFLNEDMFLITMWEAACMENHKTKQGPLLLKWINFFLFQYEW